MKAALRELVWRRANSRCEYCKFPQDFLDVRFHIEHIIARKHHGADDDQNLALSCHHCNEHKGPNIAGIDPLTHELVPLYNPRTHDWDEHFTLIGATMTGLTPVGRATVDVLNLNDDYMLELRRDLLATGAM
ncbi:MAG: HNH endonuclease [Gemmataceae bacterium]